MDDWQKKIDNLAADDAKEHYYGDQLKLTHIIGFKKGFEACEREMLKSHPVVLALVEKLKNSILYMEMSIPELSHTGSCTPESGCDASCAEAFNISRSMCLVEKVIKQYQAAIKE